MRCGWHEPDSQSIHGTIKITYIWSKFDPVDLNADGTEHREKSKAMWLKKQQKTGKLTDAY